MCKWGEAHVSSSNSSRLTLNIDSNFSYHVRDMKGNNEKDLEFKAISRLKKHEQVE